MKKFVLLFIVTIFLFTGPLAFAWEKGTLGFLYKIDPVGRNWYEPITINTEKCHYIGVMYNFTPRVALKTSFLFSIIREKYTDEGTGEDLEKYNTTKLGAQIDVPISVYNINKFDFYFSPAARITYAPVTIESPIGTKVTDINLFELTGLINLGGQFMVNENFAIFGEWGIAFGYTRAYEDLLQETIHGYAFHTDQAGIGIIFYLGQ